MPKEWKEANVTPFLKKEVNLPERVKIECKLYADDSKFIGIIEKNKVVNEIQKFRHD